MGFDVAANNLKLKTVSCEYQYFTRADSWNCVTTGQTRTNAAVCCLACVIICLFLLCGSYAFSIREILLHFFIFLKTFICQQPYLQYENKIKSI